MGHLIIVPGLVLLFQQIHKRYREITREVSRSVELKTAKVQPPIVIIPIGGWDRVAERALRFGMEMSDDVIALHVTTENEATNSLRELWIKNVEQPQKERRPLRRAWKSSVRLTGRSIIPFWIS